jgi:AraC-like DNA-binding protein
MATFEPYLTVRAVQPLVSGLDSLGHPVDTILNAAGIPRRILEDPDARVPQRAMSALWSRALEVTNDADLGIHLAEAASMRSFEVHGYAMLSSPTLRDAYRRACRYQRLIHEVTDLTLDETPREGVLRHALPGGRAAARHPAEFLATLWVRIGREVTRSEWTPNLVCFAHEAPDAIAEHTRVFAAPLRFASGRTAMHIANAVLDAVNPRADPSLGVVLDRYADSVVAKLPRRNTLTSRLNTWLLSTLADGDPVATAAASAMNLSVRSLHRGLRAEATTFRELVARLRYERATVLLGDLRYSMTEVAFMLGFSELSSFYRAFKRWSGTTPADFRTRR